MPRDTGHPRATPVEEHVSFLHLGCMKEYELEQVKVDRETQLENALAQFSEAAATQGLSPACIEEITEYLSETGKENFTAGIRELIGPRLREVPALSQQLEDFLDPECIQGNLAATSWPPVVSEAIRLLKRRARHLDLALPFRELLDRAMDPSWFPGAGLGLPHVAIPGLEEPVLVLIRLRSPLKLGTADAQPVRLFFFLFEPEKNPELHLTILRRIALLLTPVSNRGLLHATTDRWALYQTVLALDDSTPQ